MSSNKPIILAHRGATEYAPENSWEAINKAIALGIPGLEFDLRLTADDQLVCFHDENAKRLTGIDKKISELGSTHLRQLKLQSPSPDQSTTLTGRTAFFDDLLEIIPHHLLLNIEMKGPNWRSEELQKKLIVPLQKKGLVKQVVISSFFPFPLMRIKRLDPTIRLGFLIHDTHLRVAQPGWASRFLKPYSIHPEYHLATPGRIALWKSSGYAIFVWTVNEPNIFRRLVQDGVDGVITDVPELLGRSQQAS